MRFLLFTVVFFLIAAVIKIDLTEGTVPLAAFDTAQEIQACEQQISIKALSVATNAGDTVQGLLAAYPSEVEVSYPERMAQFYELNPHLQKQSMVPGELIKIPIYDKIKNEC
ncbi:hypothetical protein D1B33_06550 [Lysinibacillus yapensis]|uniref:LysM domain-containing protein n=1 Tax=Ureibacillus yapensis TaxID=2304605 RepID=A0A396SBN1_9BACL|nr:hypothetical protein [Lysinibacillus yapensis]RHW38532.1 hypothetical protein D1B33_06550 [Lysinibacillus yapensis]